MKHNSSRPSGEKSLSATGRAIKRSLALEPRVLLDAAAADTAVAVASSADLALTAATTGAGAGHEVVFIDGAVSNISQLLQGMDLQRYDVHILDSSSDGLAQMADILAASQGVTAVHVISHGADGAAQFGNVTLTAANLSTEQAQLARIGQALGNGADILLYGCDIAADSAGRSFVDSLSALTGHDVAASTDITGLSGNWDLEYHQGLIQTDSLHLTSYGGDLNLDGIIAGEVAGVSAQSQEFGSYIDADGPWVVAAGANSSNTTPTVTTWLVSGTSRTAFTVSRPDTTNWTVTFGQGVAIDANSETLVIADPNAGSFGKLAVYKLARDGSGNITGWTLAATLVPTVGRIGASSSGYGKDYLAISGNHIVVGAPNEGSNSGAVIWYSDISSGAWTTYNTGYFNEPETGDGGTATRFGTSVAVAQDYLLVSSPGLDNITGDGGYLQGAEQGNCGRVYVYSWTSNAATGPGGAANGATAATRFTAASPSPSAWSYLSGQDDMNGLDGGNGIASQYFGASIGMDYYNGVYTVAIGAPGDGSNDGKVYIYQSTTASMNSLGYNADTTKDGAIGLYNLSTSNAASKAGSSVDVSQGRIIVSAPFHTTTAQNALWYFEAPNNNWNALQATSNDVDASVGTNLTSKGIVYKVFTENSVGHTAGSYRFGYSVALAQGNTVVTGSPYYNTGAAGALGGVEFLYMRTPVAANDTTSMGEDANTTTYMSIDILANDIKGTESVGTTVGANTFTVGNISVSGYGDAYWDSATSRLMYRQGTGAGGASNYNYLAAGETAKVIISYKLTGDDFNSTATVTVTVNGANDNPSYVAGSIPTISGNRTIDTNGSVAGGVANGGTVGYYTGDPTTPFYQIQSGSFSDPDITNTFTYSLDAALTSAAIAASGSSVSVSSTGKITWNLTATLATGTYTVGVKATDNSGGTGSGSVSFTVLRDDIRPETQSANLPSGNIVTWTQNAASTQSVVTWFKDVDTTNAYSADETLTYSISYTGPGSSSGWLSIRSDTGLLQGTPTNDNVGDTTVTVQCTDKYGQYVTYAFTLTVKNVNDAPILNGSIDPQQAGQGTAFSFQVPGWSTAGSLANESDDLFDDPDSPGSVMTYTASLVDASGNLIRNLSASTGTGAGGWLTFSGGTYNPGTFATTGTATFGGTSNDAIGTKLYVKVTSTDSGTSWNGTAFVSDPKSTSYTFTIQTFAPTISLSPTGSAGSAAAELGTAVAISRDGLYMVVGAPNDSQKGTLASYFWNGTAWAAMSTAFTVPGAVVSGDRFGQSLALDYNGDRLLVGATGTTSGAGTVYAFTRTGTGTASTWTLAATYVEAGTGNTRNAGDGFGTSLAFYSEGASGTPGANDGASFIVGAPFDSDSQSVSGKAFLFAWGNTTPTATVVPTTDTGDSNTAYDEFGYSVAYSGNIAVIGAPGDTHNGKFGSGSVTVLAISSTTSPTVSASSKATLGTASKLNDNFGYSVSLQMFDGIGNGAGVLDAALLAVGVPGSDKIASDAGAVYLYRADNLISLSATRASVLASATPTLFTAFDGLAFQRFGSSVKVSVANAVEASGTNRLLISSQQTADSTGSVYIFKYVTAWNGERFIPTGTGAANGMAFGYAIDFAMLPASNNPNWVAGAPYSGSTSYDGRFYASTASAATALSLDSGAGGGGGLVPMDTGSTTTSSSSSALVPMDSASSSSSTSSSSTTTSSALAPMSMDTTTTSSAPTTTTTTSSSSGTQTFSDMLLMDMMTSDSLGSGSGTSCTDASSCLAFDGSRGVPGAQRLSQQLELMQAKRQRGALALLDDLEALVS